MLGSHVLGAVLIVVPEVPCFVWLDGFVASPARGRTCEHFGYEGAAQGLMTRAISALVAAASRPFVLAVVLGAVPTIGNVWAARLWAYALGSCHLITSRVFDQVFTI